MDKPLIFNSRHRTNTASLAFAILAVAALFAGPQLNAQQSKLRTQYAKAAFESAKAVESDDSEGQGNGAVTVGKIEAADKQAMSPEELAMSKIIHEIYYLHLHDKKLVLAYDTLMEIDSDHEITEGLIEKKRKDSAVSQFADVEESIVNHEKSCLTQLERSLAETSPEEPSSCRAWIEKANASSMPVARSGSIHVLAVNADSGEDSR